MPVFENLFTKSAKKDFLKRAVNFLHALITVMPCSDELLVGIKISSPAGFRRVHFSHVLINHAVKRDLRKLLFTGIYDSIMDLQQKNENNFLWLNCALCEQPLWST